MHLMRVYGEPFVVSIPPQKTENSLHSMYNSLRSNGSNLVKTIEQTDNTFQEKLQTNIFHKLKKVFHYKKKFNEFLQTIKSSLFSDFKPQYHLDPSLKQAQKTSLGLQQVQLKPSKI
jgi:hypothetical protein